MNEKDKKRIAEIMEQHGVIVGYLFGSALRGTMGPHSDIDVGVLFGEDAFGQDNFNKRMKLSFDITRELGVVDTDVIDLKTARGPLIKYQAIFGGELILDVDSDARFALERMIVREYEDTKELRRIRDNVLRQELKDGSFGKLPV